MDFSLGNKRQRFTQLYRSRSTQKRIFWFRINRYRKKLLISFRLLSIIYKICKNHKKWSKTAARRAVLIFQTGFSQPVDREFWIFLAKDNLRKKICPQSPCLPSQVAHSLQNVICKILKQGLGSTFYLANGALLRKLLLTEAIAIGLMRLCL